MNPHCLSASLGLGLGTNARDWHNIVSDDALQTVDCSKEERGRMTLALSVRVIES
jgi:hypothetical protein